MPLIKRYANRKLYDTEAGTYIKLEEIAEFIRRGEEVKVVDHVTGEDLTTQILLQILLEEEKKIGGLLPQVFFRDLIQTGSSAFDTFRTHLVAALDPNQHVENEIKHRIQNLIDNQQISSEEGTRLSDLLTSLRGTQEDVYHSPAEPSEDAASGEDMEALMKQLDELEKQLKDLSASSKPEEAQ